MADRGLVLVTGPPGAGKSTYAARLARETGAVLLELDTVSEPIVQAALHTLGRDPDDRDSPFYKATFRQPVYDALLATAVENLRAGQNVIVVGPFTRELTRPDWPDRLAAQIGAPVAVHYVTAEPATRRSRLESRANPRDRAKLEAWSTHLEAYPAPACPHQRVVT